MVNLHLKPPTLWDSACLIDLDDKCSNTVQLEVRITPFMFNCRFHMAKRPLRQDAAACIAFWRIATPKTGHLLPESLQRFWGGLRAGSCGVWFRSVLVSKRGFLPPSRTEATSAVCRAPFGRWQAQRGSLNGC